MLDDKQKDALGRWYRQQWILDEARQHASQKAWDELESLIHMRALVPVTRVSELPAVMSLGDAESMVAGRALSGFEEFELLARVSLSGGPAAASGDWFGTVIVRPADANSVYLSIDQQVP